MAKTIRLFSILLVGCTVAHAQMSPAEQARRKARLTETRQVGDAIETPHARGWCDFGGKVLQHHADGVRILGHFHDRTTDASFEGEFVVVNFPFEVPDNEFVGGHDLLLAKQDGLYEYSSVLGGPRKLRKLDYGKLIIPRPMGIQELELARAEREKAAEAARVARQSEEAATDARVLAWQQQQAANGSAYAQLALGIRYRDGRGVEKDLVAARSWLEKAAAQSDPEAKAALSSLPPR